MTYTRTPPGGIVAGTPAFQAVGDVFITNSSPLNAQLREVTVSLSNPFGGAPYTATATCPILTVAAGQTLQCRYVASPPFNPIGGQVVAIAHYLNLRNGMPTGATTPFTSAAVTMAGGISPREPSAAPAGQTTQQPGAPVPQMVIPSVSRKRSLLSSALNDALSSVVRQVSVSTTNGMANRMRTASASGSSSSSYPSGVGIASAQPAASSRQQAGHVGREVVKDILKNIVASLDSSEAARDKKESGFVSIASGNSSSIGGPGHFMKNIMKTANFTLSSVSGNNTQDALHLLVNLLPKLPSMGINVTTTDAVPLLVNLLPKLPDMGVNVTTTDWVDVLELMRNMLPEDGFANLVKRISSHVPSLPKLPALPKLPSLPKGPTITINTTGPIEDDFEEKTLDNVSKVLTLLTHVMERSNKSTVTVTARSMTPEAMLSNALEALAGHQHHHGADDEDATQEGDATDMQESGSLLIEEEALPTSAAVAGRQQLLPEQGTAPLQLQGLSDECVDVTDAFAAGNGYTTGMVVGGALPSGRICDTTTFTYTVRYGPYAECFDRKALNRATFTTADTNTTGEASTNTNVLVQGCGPAVTASIKSYAVWAKKGYSWSVQKSVSPAKLQANQGEQSSAEYTVSYTRHEVLTAPKLSATVQFDNLNLQGAASLSTFSYKVTSSCPDGAQTRTGTFSCPSSTIPAGGAPLTCKFKVDLPCAAPGVLLANAAVEDKAVRSSAFNFPAPEPTELADADLGNQLSTGECVMVSVVVVRIEFVVQSSPVLLACWNGTCSTFRFVHRIS